MPLQYIIDGYNIIYHPLFAKNHKKIFKDIRLALLEFIRAKRLCGSPKNEVTVVFDGYCSDPELKEVHSNVNVIFSRDMTADDKIKRLVEGTGNIKNIIVVSDDREIKFFVKSSKAKCIGIEEFMGQDEKVKTIKENDSVKSELNYSQMHKINEELKKIWLGKN
jgi:predicted RNA-binding protein with PIN domain